MDDGNKKGEITIEKQGLDGKFRPVNKLRMINKLYYQVWKNKSFLNIIYEN